MSGALSLVRASPVAARGQMTASLARLAVSRDDAVRPVRRALTTAALGRISGDERDWADRIEARRRALAADRAATGPSFDPGSEGPQGKFSMGRRPTTVAVASSFMSLPPQWCLLLMRLVRELRPGACLELGTGFGISTAYQAAALRLNGAGTLITLEGAAAWSELASEGLSSLGLDGVERRVGPIAESLPAALERSGPFDFVFIDAEHQAEATIDHFETLLASLRDRAVVVVDDVDWPEMKRAQEAIGRHHRVSTSLSSGRLGISIIAAAP